jgi:cytochrome c553
MCAPEDAASPHIRMNSRRRDTGQVLQRAIAAFAGLFLVTTECAAQQRPNAPVIVDDLKPLFATPEDIQDGRKVANSACAACHELNGVSAADGVPSLAGQRPVYLYTELKAYRAGARGSGVMTEAVRNLSNTALLNSAAYYASLDPPQSSGSGAPQAFADPVEAGKTIAADKCAGCHGDNGVSKTPGMPSLVGLDPQYLVTAMKAYANDQRKNELMKSMVSLVDESDFNKLALYYALQPAARAETPNPGDQAAGKSAAASCSGCHGESGVSTSAANPSLAGQDAQYLAAALGQYKDGSRQDETMKAMVGELAEPAMKNIAAYFAQQRPQAPNVRKPLSTEEWARRCDRCHGLSGNSTDPATPALAGQRADYLAQALKDYRAGTRKSPQMAAMSDVLTDSDIDNLAAHYASQKARSIVFVPLK